MAVGQRKPTASVKKAPADAFIRCDRSDIPVEVELRTNWINAAAIAMVTKSQRGNAIHVTILWTCGKSTKLEGQAAKLFLEKWESKPCTH